MKKSDNIARLLRALNRLDVRPLQRSEIFYLTKEEVEAVFRRVRSLRDRLMLDLAYRHGLRRKEVGLIRMSDLLPDGTIWITRVKNGVSGPYQLHPITRELIEQYRPMRRDDSPYLLCGRQRRATPLSPSLVYQVFRRYAAEAGVSEDRQHVHVLRHSIAVHMMNEGLDVADVQDWLGHRRITSTLVYARITSKRRRESYARIVQSPEIAATI
ncbi:MAG TPA: tyrosine-type recombinase/integrase [Thermoanaerobaculia bacterium]|nr:tyrosine-type recombinase/integrase [Thermoanaerobaculia bacterium]